MERGGHVLYSRSVHPLKRSGRALGYVVGFDTEYTSKGAELLSVQLWHKDNSLFKVWPKGKKLTPRWLYKECVKLVGRTDQDFILITYFSLAELQFLPVVSEGFQIREYGRGGLDVQFAIKGTRQRLKIFDLARWFDGKSLAKAAKSVGLRKLEFNTKKVTRSSLKHPKFKEYALHDAYLDYEITERLRNHFIGTTGIDPISVKTPASASASAFRHLYVKDDMWCDNNRARYCAMRGAWGGRAEAFRRGKLKGVYHEYDFTSAYPTSGIAMGEMPIQGSWKEAKSLRGLTRMRGGFAEVSFQFAATEPYPCLPVFTQDAMIYPLRGRSWCTFEEVKQALAMGAQIDVIEAWGYHRGTTALRDYLQWTLEERSKAQGAGKVMFKLLGNALIGKFAQQINKVPLEEYYRLAEEGGYYLDEMFELSSDELIALGASSVVSVGPVYMPEWNGLITGYTRAALAELVCSGKAVYCHTDSAWCRKRPKCERLPFEIKTSGPATVLRTRFAGIGKPLSANGVKKGKTHVAHHSIWSLDAGCKMIRRFRSDGFEYEYTIKKPLKFRESIKRKDLLGRWVEMKRIGQTYWGGKRRLLSDGSTVPWPSVTEYLQWKGEEKCRRKQRKGKRSGP
jgi:hypothetical protein